VLNNHHGEAVIPLTTESTKWNELETLGLGFSEASKDLVAWAWEDRFQMASCSFPTGEKADRLRELLSKYLVEAWDQRTISQAPPPARNLCEDMGGLRAGQLFLTSPPSQGDFLFAAWWPWGNGTTISLRVGLASQLDDEDEAARRTTAFRRWFGG
jgi:hypothetical protein